MKRAAIIITDEPHVHRLLVDFTRPGITLPGSVLTLDTSERLLADLRLLAGNPPELYEAFTDPGFVLDMQHAAARVREWLPKEGGKDE